MNRAESQKTRILHALMSGRVLTVLGAIKEFGTTELRKRISELKNEGYIIQDTFVEDGDKRYKQYWINRSDRVALG